MKKMIIACSLVSFLLLITACPNPSSSSGGNSGATSYTTNGSSVTLSFSDNGAAKSVVLNYGPAGPSIVYTPTLNMYTVLAYQSSSGGDNVMLVCSGGYINVVFKTGAGVEHDYQVSGLISGQGTTVGSTVSLTKTYATPQGELGNAASTFKLTGITISNVPIISLD